MKTGPSSKQEKCKTMTGLGCKEQDVPKVAHSKPRTLSGETSREEDKLHQLPQKAEERGLSPQAGT